MQQQALTGFEQATEAPAIGRAPRHRVDSDLTMRPSFIDSLKESARLFFRFYGNKVIPSYALRRLSQCESQLFESKKKIEDPIIFSNWLKVAVGWCTWAPGSNGGIVPIANPHGYHCCTDEELNDLFLKEKSFFGSKHARKFLWGHLSGDKQAALLYQFFPDR
jgi:hypothetical protein